MAGKQILLADADVQAMDEFRRALGEQWDVTPANSGTAALAELEKTAFDIIVADLDLPDIDGAELLQRSQQKYPQTIRVILANPSDQERVMKHVLGAHQFLSKPCDPATLKTAVDRALALKTSISSNNIRDLVSRVRTLPTMPSLYLEVLAALRSPDVTTKQIGEIIAKDMAMMTKLLRVLNSACFGLSRKISDPSEAVGILGFETVKSLVMSIKLLNEYDKVKPVYFSIDRLWRHSTEVARCARQLTLRETGNEALAEAAYTAGLLHDVGKVVLAANFDQQYQGAQSLARKQQIPLWEVERELFGANHGEIGAYLLGLWGMPIDLQEAAALHHEPSRGACKGFTVLTAVHVANALDYESNPDKEGFVSAKIDEAYIAGIGLTDRLSVWRAEAPGRNSGDTDFATRTIEKKPARPAAAAASQESRPAVRAAKPGPAEGTAGGPPWYMQPAFQILAGIAAAVILVLLTWLLFPGGASPVIVKGRDILAAGRTVTAIPNSVSGLVVSNDAPKTARPAALAAEKNPAASETISAPEAGKLLAAKPAVIVPPAAPAEFPNLKLQGIFFSDAKPAAIINGQMVNRDDRILGVKILAIDKSSVTLEFHNQRKTLVMK